MVLLSLLLLMFVIVVGVPIPFAFIVSSLFIVVTGGYDPSFLLPHGYSKINSVVVLAIPLFVMAGSIINRGGIGDKLVFSVEKIFGKVKGSLGVVTIIASAIFGGISGSASATTSCIGSIVSPKLKEQGYSAGYIGALISNSGLLGMLIPPSSIIILYAWLANVSVLEAFLSTVVPGIILLILFSALNLIIVKNDPKILLKSDLHETRQRHGKKKWGAGPALLMPVIVLGSIYGGFLTPTEAAAVSVAYAIIIGMFIYKKLDIQETKAALVYSSMLTGAIMIMLFGVMIISRLYILEDLPGQLLAIFLSISENPYVIMLIINLFIIIIGMIMDDISAILMITPILLPIVKQIGVDPIHFCSIITVNLGIANISPPTAPVLYLGGKIAGAELKDMLKPTLIFIILAWVPTLLMVIFLPQLALYLPNKLM